MAENRSISLRDLCAKLKVEPPAGCADLMLTGISSLNEASASEVAYVQKQKFAEESEKSAAGFILAPANVVLKRTNVLYFKDVMDAVITVLEHFHPKPTPRASVDPSAVVANGAEIGADVFIGAGVVIEDGVRIGAGSRIEAQTFIGHGSVLGDGCWLHPRVTIAHGSQLGKRVEIHSGAVIGADGFRYEKTRGRLCKIPQVGIVVLEDDVEIGANTTIDRAALRETRVGARTKIDNLVQIGHNVRIGSDCIIVAQVGIAGSCVLGRGVMIGGAAVLKDHITIGDGSQIAGRSSVQHSLPPGSQVIGSPAISLRNHAQFMFFYKNFSTQWGRVKKALDMDCESRNEDE
ncbi:UDP-3-O-(3-hydroxymyristoyl)glucosamine N-acyltransferase [soil metagenome]